MLTTDKNIKRTIMFNSCDSMDPDGSLTISIAKERLASLIKTNISCYANKTLTQELIDTISLQIVDSVEYFLNDKEKSPGS